MSQRSFTSLTVSKDYYLECRSIGQPKYLIIINIVPSSIGFNLVLSINIILVFKNFTLNSNSYELLKLIAFQ